MDFHPVDALASRFRNIGQQWRSHPFQQLALLGAGALGGPLAARAAQFGFNRYNNAQTRNSIADRTVQQGNTAGQRGFDKPLNGALGGNESGDRNGDLAMALMGAGGRGAGPYGGTGEAGSGAYNMAQQWANSHGGMGNLMAGMPGGGGNYGPSGSFFSDPRYDPSQWGGNTGLDLTSSPSSSLGTFFTDPQYDPANQQGSGNLRESRENDTRTAMTPLMQGVTNFSVGGFPVINGSRGYGAFGGSGQGYFKGRTPGR